MAANPVKKLFHFVFSTVDRRVAFYIRAIVFLKKNNLRLLGIMVSRRLQNKYGVFLPYSAEFDASLILRHPIGIVIGEGVHIGTNVTIFQNVTLGRSDTNISAYPILGDNTIVYAGAVLVGNIKVGRNCIVGANAVVTKDMPDNSIAVGVPARIILRETA